MRCAVLTWPMFLGARYAGWGTETGYGATQCGVFGRLCSYALRCAVLRYSDAVSGTERSYATMQCKLLR
eukprot:2343167-Rhodomonas_salina.3